MEDIKKYIEKYVAFGKPIPCHGLMINPVLVKDFYQFNDAKNVLLIDKNRIPDIEIIQMTYLHFLTLMLIEREDIREDFLTILAITLGLKYDSEKRDASFEPNEVLAYQTRKDESILIINGWDVVFRICENQTFLQLYEGDDMIEINDDQFNDLKDIILFQNIHDYDNMEMSADFRKVIEEYYAIKNKDIVIPTLEDRMMAVVVSSSYTLEQLYDLPLRLFDALFEYSLNKLEYQVNKLIVNLAQGEIKGFSLSHWVYKTKKDKYSEIFTNAQDLVNKFNSL